MKVKAKDFQVQAWSDLKDEEPDELARLKDLFDEAKKYLLAFKWCRAVSEGFFGLGVGGVVGVFLFEIENSASPEDSRLWVIVGDLPSAYLEVREGDSPSKALASYIELMREWVEAAGHGRPVGDLIPVNVPATPANAQALDKRLAFLQREFLDDRGSS